VAPGTYKCGSDLYVMLIMASVHTALPVAARPNYKTVSKNVSTFYGC